MSNIDKALFDKINEQSEIYLLHYLTPLELSPLDYWRWRFTLPSEMDLFFMSMVKFDIFAENRFLSI